jgi:preprotein translocase subunit SecD
MQKQRLFLALIFVLVIAAVTVIATIPVPLGLDLKGGSQLTIQVKTTPEIKQIGERELEAVQTVLGNRVNGLGVSEPLIQTVGNDKISVQLPGVSDPEQAERVLGGTAQLEFKTQKPETETQLFALRANRQQLRATQAELLAAEEKDKAAIENLQQQLKTNQEAISELFQSLETPLTGKYLTNANALPQQGSLWSAGLQFDQKGGELFAELTKNLAGT